MKNKTSKKPGFFKLRLPVAIYDHLQIITSASLTIGSEYLKLHTKGYMTVIGQCRAHAISHCTRRSNNAIEYQYLTSTS